jgi:hypothetical protein
MIVENDRLISIDVNKRTTREEPPQKKTIIRHPRQADELESRERYTTGLLFCCCQALPTTHVNGFFFWK